LLFPAPPPTRLQSEGGLLFDVIAPALQAFPDISQHPTMCGKAHAITTAYSGKTLLIPLPNPRYSLKSAATQPRYKLHPLDLSTDPSFQLMAVAFETCARSSEASICDVTKQIVLDLAENGPFWLKAFVSSERVVSINRWVFGEARTGFGAWFRAPVCVSESILFDSAPACVIVFEQVDQSLVRGGCASARPSPGSDAAAGGRAGARPAGAPKSPRAPRG